MTVMVWDGTSLAVDSRVTAGGRVISDTFCKMFEISHPKLGPMVGAVAGACSLIGPWLENLNSEGFTPVCLPGMDDDYSMTGLFIDVDGNCWEVRSDGGYFLMGKTPEAIGSGSDIARYLLSKKKNALTACREACDADLFCGGEIRVFNSKTGKITIHTKE